MAGTPELPGAADNAPNDLRRAIHEELRCKIMLSRLSRGETETPEVEEPIPAKSELNPEEWERKLRRQEQNRRAARKCRSKKKEQQNELLITYNRERKRNEELQASIKKLQRELQSLKDSVKNHRCKIPATDPDICSVTPTLLPTEPDHRVGPASPFACDSEHHTVPPSPFGSEPEVSAIMSFPFAYAPLSRAVTPSPFCLDNSLSSGHAITPSFSKATEHVPEMMARCQRFLNMNDMEEEAEEEKESQLPFQNFYQGDSLTSPSLYHQNPSFTFDKTYATAEQEVNCQPFGTTNHPVTLFSSQESCPDISEGDITDIKAFLDDEKSINLNSDEDLNKLFGTKH